MEQLLNQIISGVAEICPGADLMQVKVKTAGILAMYDIRPGKITVGHPDVAEKVKLFLAAKKLEGVAQSTLNGYTIQLRVFASYINKRVEDITTSDLRQYLGVFENLKISSISTKLSVLKSFFGWLTEEEIIIKDPTRKIKPPKKEKRLPKALNIEELEMIREACKTKRERALIEVFYATGGRLSEIQGLNRQDINWQTSSAKVFGKGSKERDIYFSWKAQHHLKQYLKRRDDAVPALFITERKPYRRVGNRAIQRAIKKIAERSEVQKNVTPHVFRHTFATLTLNNGADLVAVQSLLGHSNPGTTQIYAQLTDGRRKEQYQKYLVQ